MPSLLYDSSNTSYLNPIKGGGGGEGGGGWGVHPAFICETLFEIAVTKPLRGFRTPGAHRCPWDSHAHSWPVFAPNLLNTCI